MAKYLMKLVDRNYDGGLETALKMHDIPFERLNETEYVAELPEGVKNWLSNRFDWVYCSEI